MAVGAGETYCEAGYEAILTLGGATIGFANDVTLTLRKNLAAANRRSDEGWTRDTPALRGLEATCSGVYAPDAAGFDILLAAWFNDTILAAVFTKAGGATPFACDVLIGNIDFPEPEDDTATISFTLRSQGIVRRSDS